MEIFFLLCIIYFTLKQKIHVILIVTNNFQEEMVFVDKNLRRGYTWLQILVSLQMKFFLENTVHRDLLSENDPINGTQAIEKYSGAHMSRIVGWTILKATETKHMCYRYFVENWLFPALLKYNCHITFCKFKYKMWWFDTCIYCKISQ